MMLPSRKLLATVISGLIFSPVSFAEEYWFDPELFQGSAYGKNLEKFNRKEEFISPGDYLVDVYVNQKVIMSSVKVNFVANLKEKSGVVPCVPSSVISAANIITDIKKTDGCLALTKWLPEAEWELDQSELKLMLSIPDKFIFRTPRGYIPQSEWDEGVNAVFLRHNTNYSFTENTTNKFHYSYLWSGLQSGVNIGLWQFRHQANLRYADTKTSGGSYRYNSVRTWIQRPIPAIESTFSVGESYTNSSLFGSLSFNGIKLNNDQRMWPQGKRGYAPEVRGVADSSARVIVSQLGKVIHEARVSPGPFVINDLYNTQNQGDLEVEIVEATGKSSTFIVPYSAVPDSVRPGNWLYSLALGRVRHYHSVENAFFEGVWQRGISNNLTSNFGSRIADDYMAYLFGGVWTTGAGAFGLNTTWSYAKTSDEQKDQGWRAEASYSKTFPSRTNLALAAYRYSTTGFRDLQDVLGVRRQTHTGREYYSETLRQRHRLSATVSQPLKHFGSLNLSASTADYHNNQSRITQFQMGYSNNWQQVSYNVNVARQRTSWDNNRFNFDVNEPLDDNSRQKYTENTVSLGISMPLDWNQSRSSVGFNVNQSREMRSATANMSGSAGENNNTSWSLYGGYESSRHQNGNASTWGASAQQNTRYGALRSSVDMGQHYRQVGFGTAGTVVAHSGGITAGPYASETFAIIHAEGAQGATVNNGQGAVIDRFGYAIMPSLAPYNNNTVSIDSRHMSANADLIGGSERIVPYAGAISRIKFETLSGRAVLINLSNPDDSRPPMGAEIFNAEGINIGMVGQGGQIYARISANSGTLRVSWGKGETEQCFVRYQLPAKSDDAIIQLNQMCEII